MAYDTEKYRIKREKVLGIRKRGLTFTVLAVAVSAVFFVGLGFLVIPPSLDWWQTRNLEDAIYKLQDGKPWPTAAVAEAKAVPGIREVLLDKDGTRLVITFDNTVAVPASFTAHFEKKGLPAVLLNRIGHRHMMNAMQKE